MIRKNLVRAACTALRFIPDEMYLKKVFRLKVGYELDLDNPQSFNEKIQWLKIHDRNASYKTIVDKADAKAWVESRIGKQYVIPTLKVCDNVEEVDYSSLPNQFVLKCTHDSGGVAICKDKANFDFIAAKRKIEKSLKTNFFWVGREWPYKEIEPRIIVEEYLRSSESEIVDYKFMCFNGSPRCVFTCTGRSTGDLRVDFFDLSWNHLPFERHYKNAQTIPDAPSALREMIDLSAALSKGIPFVRVDFYEIEGRPYFGEMTLYPGSGFEEFTPREWDYELGGWLTLPSKD